MTLEQLKTALRYDAESGVFTWLVPTSNRVKAGAVAGTVNVDGYRYIGLLGAHYLAHRLAWFYVHGAWPKQMLDHRDTDPANNALSNLREATFKLNAENKRRAIPGSATGVLGVSLGRKGKFKAQIQTNGKNRYLGEFATVEIAQRAYVVAKRAVHEGCTL